MLRMANGAFDEALKVGKERLRDFLADSEVGRQAIAMGAAGGDGGRDGDIKLRRLDSRGKARSEEEEEEDEI